MYNNLRTSLSAALLSLLVACGGGGGSTPSTSTPDTSVKTNNAPVVSIIATGLQAPAGAPANSSLSLTLGGTASLDGSSSKDPDGDTLSYEWTLVSKPASSTAAVSSPLQPQLTLKPDLFGSYTLSLKVSDGRGGVATQQIVINVDNRVPVSSISAVAQFNAIPTNMPTQFTTVGANIVLDATGATDPDGDQVSVVFELIEKPTTSKAGLSFAGKTARLVSDVQGLFKIRARGSDGKGGTFESVY
uniref:PKD domain-containing protein n=1 Tax=Undibacterium sp. TaxID=1914977 RepID=UPI003753CFA3